MAENIHEFTEGNFEAEVLESAKPVLIDFWAEWCVPCKMIAPAVEEVANENAGALKVGKVNVDNNPGIASKYGVRSIPTLLIFKGGQIAEKMVGAVSKETMQEFVDKV
ncbi:MAG: thioredoxin, partial [candidate division Zixibacteria bacterium]|nr:thioredoxin [candidate division Zixibacteria bacterium]